MTIIDGYICNIFHNQIIANSNIVINLFSPISYYRLKQTDFDGHYINSEIIASESCSQHETSNISVFPNPFDDNVTVGFNSKSNEDITITIVTMDGKKVFTKLVKVKCGENSELLNLSDIGNATYYMYLSNAPNKSYKIVKQ